MANGGPKQYPSLAKYLETNSSPGPANARLIVQILLGAIGSLAFLVGMILVMVNLVIHASWMIGGIPLGFAVLCALAAVAAQRLIPGPPKPSPLELESRETNTLLSFHMRERRLHKAAPAAVAAMLEEAARQYMRVNSTLTSAFWRSENLPDPYYSLREKARAAADRAMQETVVLLRPRIATSTKPQHWKDVVEEVAENVGLKAPTREHVFAGELEPARSLVEGLRSLADEVEQASIRAITDVHAAPGAETVLRSTLAELRALNEAEAELDKSIKFRT